MTITKTANLPVSPDDAFALITEPERLRRWMGVTARVDLRAGGAYRWTVTPGNIVIGTFKEIEPGKHIAFSWGWDWSGDLGADASVVTITVEPSGSGTLVTLVHEGLTPEQESGHQEGWDHFFERLEKTAATGDAGPDEWAAAPQNLDSLSAAEASLAVLQGVLLKLTAGDHTKQTPCAEWDCDALADHLMGSIVGIGTMAGADVVDPEIGSLENRIAVMAATALEAWRDRGTEGMVDGPFGPMPAMMATSILAIEFLVHAWDFAQASGQTVTVSDEVVSFVQKNGQAIIDGSRERGAFAAETLAGTDATALDRLAAYAGRVPVSA